ncbi:MAG: hypothetical protein COV67_02705 [Nitrospinae bacterium CG11_big_fil_rev_8_21_14_0_20_56_8]|nr:MAG: hypothetical protein COV67_02705 [Nitrospinae bacterium CG11_big_fil_rev_8_21_14_0_20_56_8]
MKVAIADSSGLVLSRLVKLLSEITGIRIVSEGLSLDTVFNQVEFNSPDIVVLDTWLFQCADFPLLRNLKERFPKVRVILLSDEFYSVSPQIFLDSGADFIFNKASGMEKFLNTIEDLEHGGTSFSPQDFIFGDDR